MAQHCEDHTNEFMRRGQYCLLIRQTFLSPFEEVGPEGFIVGNGPGRHEPDDPPEMAISPLADLALSLVLA